MIKVEEALDDLLGEWNLSDGDGPITAGSDAMSDLVGDIMMTVRKSLADDVAAFVEGQLGG